MFRTNRASQKRREKHSARRLPILTTTVGRMFLSLTITANSSFSAISAMENLKTRRYLPVSLLTTKENTLPEWALPPPIMTATANKTLSRWN